MWSSATPYPPQVPRLGALMVQRHQLDDHQLSLAVLVQNREPHRQLGDILIQLGFVSAKQLKRNLRWQNYLRCASVALAFSLAPFQVAHAGGKEEVYANVNHFMQGENNTESADEGMNLFSYSNSKLTTFWSSKADVEESQVSYDEGGLKYSADLNFDGLTLGVSFSF
ncbi:hypothetical protein R50073_06270 [Maricurvus nonylphenolicus]|uniref:hypothetical protein n=1 Tax=Maricurvus nonylphenolicus TaxID=1008307 RepID=UPI0036F197A6